MPTPEFIAALRSKVGTDLLWLTGVTAVVFDDTDRVLLGQRSDNRMWALISGILEPGEHPDAASAREVVEETGVDVAVEALTSLRVTEPVTYPNGDQAQYLDLVFWCRMTGGRAEVGDDESIAVGWFDLTDLPEPLLPPVLPTIRTTLNYRRDPDIGVQMQR
ncbi:MAG: NUDIX hydrolase [Beutenbergiaceae bacterium]